MRMVLLSAISLLGSLANLAGAAPADLPDQGPRATSMVGGGGAEVWQVGGTTCKGNVLPLFSRVKGKTVVHISTDHSLWRIVRDYGVLMPTMVYNCAYMPSICKTIKKYWAPCLLPVRSILSITTETYSTQTPERSEKTPDGTPSAPTTELRAVVRSQISPTGLDISTTAPNSDRTKPFFFVRKFRTSYSTIPLAVPALETTATCQY